MRFLLRFLTFLLFILWALFARYWYVCEIKLLCNPQEEVKEVDVRPQTLQFTYKDKVILNGYDQFRFDQGNADPVLTNSNKVFLDSIANHLNFQSDKPLKIIGYYRQNEKDLLPEGYKGHMENMGLARAETIRELLMDRGIEENRVFMDHKIMDGDSLTNPLGFLLFDAETRPDEYASQLFTFTNMSFSDANFEVNKAIFKPRTQLINYADSVATYLTIHPEKVLTIIGHTDNDGSEKYNEDLGLRRAKSARAYFKNDLGFKPYIKVASKGEKEHVAPNDTPENKQKNRRVNFQIN